MHYSVGFLQTNSSPSRGSSIPSPSSLSSLPSLVSSIPLTVARILHTLESTQRHLDTKSPASIRAKAQVMQSIEVRMGGAQAAVRYGRPIKSRTCVAAEYGEESRGDRRRRSLVSWRAGDRTYDLELEYTAGLNPSRANIANPYCLLLHSVNTAYRPPSLQSSAYPSITPTYPHKSTNSAIPSNFPSPPARIPLDTHIAAPAIDHELADNNTIKPGFPILISGIHTVVQGWEITARVTAIERAAHLTSCLLSLLSQYNLGRVIGFPDVGRVFPEIRVPPVGPYGPASGKLSKAI
ncbi:hypothetical protein M422DRAFT_272509 [Sphaerobolus stellatus SS14]|uniref:Uncharacterized protein n=1 Tax=Sphaerobolus stellatus (strain SS14) TaxID=990650 RepID=A0A0C9TBF4_SPHS4|nr:hypothetical protein M422DRAFT_272509 [Sphaerobolus stellatus SS14]